MEEIAGWIALDAASSLLLALLAVRFALIARRTRQELPLLFAAGLALLALSYPAVSLSHFGPAMAFPRGWDQLRVAGQLGGALVVLSAYASARVFGRAKPALVLGWSAAGCAIGYTALHLAVADGSELPLAGPVLAVSHLAMALAWMVSAAIAGSRLMIRFRAQQMLVPAAFASMAAGKITWLAVDLGASPGAIPFIYFARFLGIGLLMAAAWPMPRRQRGAHAAA